MIKLLHGDALDHLSRMPDNSASAVTLVAAAAEGFDDLIGIDLDAGYLRIAEARIRHATTRPVDTPGLATDDLEVPSQLNMWR